MPEAQARWEQLILDQGIVLRHCANLEGLSHDHLRCAVRDDQQNSRLIDALRPWQMGGIKTSGPKGTWRFPWSPASPRNLQLQL